MAEWLKATVLKTVEHESAPTVQIGILPPINSLNSGAVPESRDGLRAYTAEENVI